MVVSSALVWQGDLFASERVESVTAYLSLKAKLMWWYHRHWYTEAHYWPL